MEIAKKAWNKEQENFRKYEAFECHLEEIKEELNEDGVVEEKEVKSRQISVRCVPLPGGKETQRISPEMHQKNPHDSSSILDHVDLFDWKLEAEDATQGEVCYRLAFCPRKGGKNLGGREGVIAKSSGHCWVAKSDFSKRRLEGRLIHPVEVVGFFVTVREVDFLSTTRRLARGIAAPEQVCYRFLVEIFPMFEFHERHTQNFRFGETAQSTDPLKDQKGGVAGLN